MVWAEVEAGLKKRSWKSVWLVVQVNEAINELKK